MATTKKSSSKKSTAKTSTAKKKTGTAKRSTRKSPSTAAGKWVGTEIREMEAGTLRSGGSGKKVTNRKQAIAIGLSEARRAGVNVPPNTTSKKKK